MRGWCGCCGWKNDTILAVDRRTAVTWILWNNRMFSRWICRCLSFISTITNINNSNGFSLSVSILVLEVNSTKLNQTQLNCFTRLKWKVIQLNWSGTYSSASTLSAFVWQLCVESCFWVRCYQFLSDEASLWSYVGASWRSLSCCVLQYFDSLTLFLQTLVEHLVLTLQTCSSLPFLGRNEVAPLLIHKMLACVTLLSPRSALKRQCCGSALVLLLLAATSRVFKLNLSWGL